MCIICRWLNRFKHKKTVPNGYKIPKEHIVKVLELVDIVRKATPGANRVETYNLWEYIENIIPEIAQTNTRWEVSTNIITRPIIRKEVPMPMYF